MNIHCSYRLTRYDIYELNRVLLRRSAFQSVLRLVIVYLSISAIFIFLHMLDSGSLISSTRAFAVFLITFDESWWFNASLLLYAILMFNAHRVRALVASLRLRDYVHTDSMVDIAIETNGIDVRSGNITSYYKWAAFTNIIETPTHILLKTTPKQALLIPRRGFATSAEVDRMLAFVRSCLPDNTQHKAL